MLLLLSTLLAEGDWRQLLGPLVLFAVYAAAALLKKASAEKSNFTRGEEDDEEIDSVESSPPAVTASSNTPRYKPLDEVAKPADSAQSPRQRTLPYARTQPRVAPAAAQQVERERQRRLQQLRDEQIQIARRQQMARQQAEQAAALRQRAAQITPNVTAAPVVSPRKTPQEMLRQVQTGQPARGDVYPARPLRAEMPSVQTPSRGAVLKMPSVSAGLHRLLRQRDMLRNAIVLKEVLDKPLALRS